MSAAEEPDQSMEEILQSIKRIIADEDEEGDGNGDKEAIVTTDETPDIAEADAELTPQETADVAEIQDSGDDVLELTQVVHEDGTIGKAEASENELEETEEIPVQEETDVAALPAATEEKDEFVMADDALLSDDAAKASSNALEELLKEEPTPEPPPQPTTPSPTMRSGNTVEDLVLEALRPMLKEWLDTNLPIITERLVKEEIKRISPK